MEERKTDVAKYERTIADQVLTRVNALQKETSIVLPKNYAPGNALKSAWLIIQNATDKDGKKVLEVCTKESIANALFEMVIQGLSVSKKQGYFIPYGAELQFQRSYMGTIALAKNTGEVEGEPVANVVYEGDVFEYTIDVKTGIKEITKHEQKLVNIDNSKIVGAYAIVPMKDGGTKVEVMTMQQIRLSWNQGRSHGQSPAHKNFPDEMARKTVISRALKLIVNSSNDGWLYDGFRSEDDADPADVRSVAVAQSNGANALIEDADAEEISSVATSPSPSVTDTPEPENKPEKANDNDPY